jgi:Ca2+-binding RTX toxin-like protein
VISGGDGNDLLYGGSSGDVLIGGAGRDQLWGYGGSDLLIAGRTSYDGNLAAQAAVLAEWTSTRSLATRRSNLSTGSGPVLSGTGILLKPNETVFDDSEVDLLMGGGDVDWFLFDVKKDGSKDKTASEPLN